MTLFKKFIKILGISLLIPFVLSYFLFNAVIFDFICAAYMVFIFMNPLTWIAVGIFYYISQAIDLREE